MNLELSKWSCERTTYVHLTGKVRLPNVPMSLIENHQWSLVILMMETRSLQNISSELFLGTLKC